MEIKTEIPQTLKRLGVKKLEDNLKEGESVEISKFFVLLFKKDILKRLQQDKKS